MSEPHRPSNNDEEEPASTAKSAEDRKAASALASLDANDASASASSGHADSEAVNQAIKNLSGTGGAAKASSKPASAASSAPKVVVKIDQADVALLVEHLEVTKVKATEMLRSAGGEVDKVLTEFVRAA